MKKLAARLGNYYFNLMFRRKQNGDGCRCPICSNVKINEKFNNEPTIGNMIKCKISNVLYYVYTKLAEHEAEFMKEERWNTF